MQNIGLLLRRTGLSAGLIGCLMAGIWGSADAQTDADTKPLWEVGAIGGMGWIPDYPASGQNHLQWVGLPYLVYRGDIIRAGDKGIVRSRLFHNDRVEFDISVSGSFPSESEDNDARNGMTDLDWLGEVGPRLQITLARAARHAKIDFELPVRAVFSTDFSSFGHEGYVFAPELAYQNERFGGREIDLKLSLSAKFANQDLAEYFYGVPAAFATSTRAAYTAKAGYIGSHLQLRFVETMSKRWKTFAGVSADFHQGSTNDKSPLFKNSTNFSVGAGIIWSFWQSDRQVRDD